ncbi:MAG: TAXI family TRAP transporter solute-binding subunit [Alphaproteobacteria bacterium]|nr:TAXI family TRAP transporter solute-binding subunit [Alphaproteobacteria bacterium]
MTMRLQMMTVLFAAMLLAAPASAKEKTIVVHAGKPDSPNYVLARQFAGALALAGNGAFTLVVAESQGSVENVADIEKMGGDYIFTAGPSVILQAQRGDKPFTKNPRFAGIRALFPIPAQTIHFVVRRDGKIKNLAELVGQSFIPGTRGTLGERITEETFQVLGLANRVQVIDSDAAGAPAALKARQVGGFAIAGSFPLPSLVKLAKTTPIRLLGLTPAAIKRIRAADDSVRAIIIPRGTYAGLTKDVTTLALPAGAYTTLRMTNATAYALTKAFWSQRVALAKKNPAWTAIRLSQLVSLGVRLHPGALRYYREVGVRIPAGLR